MKVRAVALAVATALAGFVVGVVVPLGDGPSGPPAAEETASPDRPTHSPDRGTGPDGGTGQLPPACQEALQAADQLAAFVPEAIERMRVAYEGADGDGPPPAAVVSQIRSQSQALSGRLELARSRCSAEGAAGG